MLQMSLRLARGSAAYLKQPASVKLCIREGYLRHLGEDRAAVGNTTVDEIHPASPTAYSIALQLLGF